MEKAVLKVLTAEDALDFSMERERHSVDYYNGLKDMVPEADRNQIDAIIEEEERHYRQLEELKK